VANWLRLAAVADIGDAGSFEAAGAKIAVFRTPEGFRALDDVCSHEYSLLSEGEVWDDRVYCPKHGSAFDLATGAVCGLPATEPVRAWKVKVEGEALWVELP